MDDDDDAQYSAGHAEGHARGFAIGQDNGIGHGRTAGRQFGFELGFAAGLALAAQQLRPDLDKQARSLAHAVDQVSLAPGMSEADLRLVRARVRLMEVKAKQPLSIVKHSEGAHAF